MDELGEANTARYSSPAEVDRYLREPYHARRIEVALQLLERELVRQFPQSSRGDLVVLDLGAATGIVSELLATRGFSILAVDVEAAVLPRTAPGAPIQTMSFDIRRPFPIAPQTVHAIFAGEVIEHLFDPVAFLIHCRDVLVDRGVIVLTTPNLVGLQDRLQFLFGRSPRHVNPLHPYLKLHIRPFTPSMLKRVLRAGGFRPTVLKSNYVVFRFGETRLRIKSLARALPSLGGSLIVSAIADASTADDPEEQSTGQAALVR